MRIDENSTSNLDKIGVYRIMNLVNGKMYIGSTEKSFLSRFSTHYQKLKSNNHKGYLHLQTSVNRYGIENFEFGILEICEKKDCLIREEYWINYYDVTDRERGYNMKKIPNSSPMLVEGIPEKVGQIIRGLHKSGKMKPNSTTFKKGLIPWNKGRKYDSTDHLKVPKKKKASRDKFRRTIKEKQLPIEVYDLSMKKIGTWRYIEDIVSLSKDPLSIISKSMKLVNPNGRNGYPPTQLFNVNIRKSCTFGKSYKGLFFKYNIMAQFKQGELLEHPEMDNQQPSLSSNALEGSTTNSRVQTDNAEDSNADTSALLGYRKSDTKLIGVNFILKDGSEMFVSNDDIV